MDEYRIDKDNLLDSLAGWNKFLKRRVHLIACGGTALTLLGVKESTKDIDFMVPKLDEYEYLIKILKDLGYESTTGSGFRRKGELFVYDFFRGNTIHTTELLHSPLKKGRHILVKEFSYIYLGALNNYDLIISKLFRGTAVDFEDAASLIRARRAEIDLAQLEKHFKETAGYDVAEERMLKNWEHFKTFLIREKQQ